MGHSHDSQSLFRIRQDQRIRHSDLNAALTDTGPFSADIINLDPDTVYHFRSGRRRRRDRRNLQQDMTFATTPVPPSIDIVSIESVQSTSATLNGDLVSLVTTSSVEGLFRVWPDYELRQCHGTANHDRCRLLQRHYYRLSSNTSYHSAVADGGAQVNLQRGQDFQHNSGNVLS
jgi:hypothetical protein